MITLLLLTAALAESPSLSEVLDSVDAHFPLLVAAESSSDAARSELLGARGAFDPVLGASGLSAWGPYPQTRAAVGVRSNTAAWGLDLDAGWSWGRGDIPAYDGDLKTLAGGELYLAARLPLLKGGFTDEARTALRLGRAEIAAAEAKVLLTRLKAGFGAREAWFKWLGAGEKLRVARRMAELATTTRDAVQSRITQGDAAPIELVDAERVLAERAVKVRELERDLQIAAQKLGLYLRDAAGAPAPPDSEPTTLPAPTDAPLDLDAALRDALTQRPELLALAAKQDALRASLQLARISVLPKLDLKLGVEQDLPGADEDSEPLEVKFGGEFSLPLALRAGRGKLDAVQAKLVAVDAERAYAADTVSFDVRAAAEALAAARDRLVLVVRQVELARQVEAATRTAFTLGDRSVFDLYLREQSTLKAELDAVDVLVELHVAEAALGAARGVW